MHYNINSAELVEMSVARKESIKLLSGALCTTTGEYRGRAADAKFYVKDEVTVDVIDWVANNAITEAEYKKELSSFLKYKDKLPELFCQELKAVRDVRKSLDLIVYTETAKHSLFARNMFIPDPRDLDMLAESCDNNTFRVYHFPKKEKKAKVIISLKEKCVLITGSHYSGEIKKSIFSVLNFLFPEDGHLPMHCSVNVDKNRKNPTIFFGLSGTGKTTLSSDESRILVGDDEHGWTETGLTNFEGGCYAKTINLSKDAEPQIWEACNTPLSILENVIHKDLLPDFDDSSITENARASYPCSSVPGADTAGYVDEHPTNVVMLTCDAFGVLPAVMKLSPDEAVRQFLLGYTAKVAGTEVGVTEPQATFSACFGAPFMPQHPTRYADILKQKVKDHDTQCWLVNTGWTGGQFGVGQRMPISTTRMIIDKIHDGSLANCETFLHSYTGFAVPICTEIPTELLSPELSWDDLAIYEEKASELMRLFKTQAELNFIN